MILMSEIELLTFFFLDKISRKNNIPNPLIRTRTCIYQGVKNVSFFQKFEYALNERCLTY